MTTPDIALTTTLEPKTKLSGKVLKTTLAGALVEVGQNIPGVIHISQLSKDPVNKVEDVVKEGQTVDVWVRRVKKDRIELTMIEPLALEWKEIEPDMVVKGKVVRLEAYGAFVDIGAERPGMVHVSELAHGYVKTPNEIVKEGDEVEAKVLDVNRKKKQIKLSMKALEPEIEEFKPAKFFRCSQFAKNWQMFASFLHIRDRAEITRTGKYIILRYSIKFISSFERLVAMLKALGKWQVLVQLSPNISRKRDFAPHVL